MDAKVRLAVYGIVVYRGTKSLPRQLVMNTETHAFSGSTSPQVLMLKRKNTGFYDGYWSLPAGHVEAGENIFAAMKRELAEETAIQWNIPMDLVAIYHRTSTVSQREYVDFFMEIPFDHHHCEFPKITEPEKCADLRFLSADYLKDFKPHANNNTIEIVPFVHTVLHNYLISGKKFCMYDSHS